MWQYRKTSNKLVFFFAYSAVKHILVEFFSVIICIIRYFVLILLRQLELKTLANGPES